MLNLLFAMALLSVAFADDFSAAKALIDSNASCDSLNSTQLAMIGDYYMELMHPGEAHTLMDNMMGGEGSPSLESMHTQIARVLYCNDANTTLTYGGMMAMMPAFYGGGMMGYYQVNATQPGPAYGPGMMGYGRYGPGMMGYYYQNSSNGTPPAGSPAYGMMWYYQNTSNWSPASNPPAWGPYGMMGYGSPMGYSGFWWVPQAILFVLAVIALVLLIIWLYKGVTKK